MLLNPETKHQPSLHWLIVPYYCFLGVVACKRKLQKSMPCITRQCVHSHAQIKVEILPQNGGRFLQFSFWSVVNFVINVLSAVIDFRDKLKPRVYAYSPSPKQLLGSRFKIVQNQNKRIAIS